MEYAECHYPGQSCTCDHRPSFIPGISSSFPPLSNHSCDIMPPHPSVHYTNKKEHSNIPTMPKRPKTNQGRSQLSYQIVGYLAFDERGKTPRSSVENQQTQATGDTKCGKQTQATLVGGRCPHHCIIPARFTDCKNSLTL